jgi:uncharacterized protein
VQPEDAILLSTKYLKGDGLVARFVLWGTYCDGALQKREPFRDEHLAGLRTLKERGILITLGPTEGSTHVFAIFESDSKASVCALLEQDVYWREGIWTQLDVYPWVQAF